MLYGETIEQTLGTMLGKSLEYPADPGRSFNPDRSYTAQLLSQMDQAGSFGLGWAGRRSRRTLEQIVPTPPRGSSLKVKDRKVVVCVSGSLAHLYFTGHDQPLSLEEVLELYPGIVEDLSRHPGIGFVAASRQFGDAVAICDDGIRNLITGELGGEADPSGGPGIARYLGQRAGLAAELPGQRRPDHQRDLARGRAEGRGPGRADQQPRRAGGPANRALRGVAHRSARRCVIATRRRPCTG